MLTKTCKYGMQALIFIASLDINEYVLSKQISAALSIPKEYLNKVMQLLVKAGFVVSIKGPMGGFRLARDPRDITLFDIVKALDGVEFFDGCILRSEPCDEANPCALHFYWRNILIQIRGVLDSETLADLVNELKEGKRVLQFDTNYFLLEKFKEQIGIK